MYPKEYDVVLDNLENCSRLTPESLREKLNSRFEKIISAFVAVFNV